MAPLQKDGWLLVIAGPGIALSLQKERNKMASKEEVMPEHTLGWRQVSWQGLGMDTQRRRRQ